VQEKVEKNSIWLQIGWLGILTSSEHILYKNVTSWSLATR